MTQVLSPQQSIDHVQLRDKKKLPSSKAAQSSGRKNDVFETKNPINAKAQGYISNFSKFSTQ